MAGISDGGYGNETEFESVFDTSVDTTRFGNLSVAICREINLFYNNDASVDISDAGDLHTAKNITHEKILKIITLSKSEKMVNPFAFLSIALEVFALSDDEKERFAIMRVGQDKKLSYKEVTLA